MKTAAILQIRTDSTRLPGKAFLDVSGKTLIERCIDNLQTLNQIYDKVAVVTTNRNIDDGIVSKCREYRMSVYRGSVENVLDRYAQTLENIEFKDIVWVSRLTGDNPFVVQSLHSQILEAIKSMFVDHDVPRIISTRKKGIAKGLDVEIFNLACLKYAACNAVSRYDLEHVTPFMYKSSDIITVGVEILQPDIYFQTKGFTIDNLDDWNEACRLAPSFQVINESIERVLQWKFL